MTNDAIVLCPVCQRTQPAGTVFCRNCTTSLHNAQAYIPLNRPVAATSEATATATAAPATPIPQPTAPTFMPLRSQSFASAYIPANTAPAADAALIDKPWWRRFLPPDYRDYSQIDGVRSNNYYSLRLAAAKMTSRATVLFTIAGVLAVASVFLSVIGIGFSIYQAIIEPISLLGIPLSIVGGLIIAYVLSWPFLRAGYRVLEVRDELLMRIDTAINTATMAAAIQRMSGMQ